MSAARFHLLLLLLSVSLVQVIVGTGVVSRKPSLQFRYHVVLSFGTPECDGRPLSVKILKKVLHTNTEFKALKQGTCDNGIKKIITAAKPDMKFIFGRKYISIVFSRPANNNYSLAELENSATFHVVADGTCIPSFSIGDGHYFTIDGEEKTLTNSVFYKDVNCANAPVSTTFMDASKFSVFHENEHRFLLAFNQD